jgi:hypothetical protein
VNQKAFGVFVLARLAPTITADLPLVRELLKRVSYKLQIFFLTTHLTAPL